MTDSVITLNSTAWPRTFVKDTMVSKRGAMLATPSQGSMAMALMVAHLGPPLPAPPTPGVILHGPGPASGQ